MELLEVVFSESGASPLKKLLRCIICLILLFNPKFTSSHSGHRKSVSEKNAFWGLGAKLREPCNNVVLQVSLCSLAVLGLAEHLSTYWPGSEEPFSDVLDDAAPSQRRMTILVEVGMNVGACHRTYMQCFRL
eukprot:1478155-Amphidinium_carterae.1